MIGYIFDFDGVIADSMSLHLKTWTEAYHKTFDKEINNATRLAGMSSEKIATILCEENKDLSKVHKLISLKKTLMKKKYPNIELLPGAKTTIKKLKALNIPVGICSNATGEFIEQVLSNNNLSVDTLVSIESTNTPKPHPGPYLLAAKNLGFSVNQLKEVAGFEDSRHGMRAIKEAGLFGVGILSLQKKDELISCGAKKIFLSLAEAIKDPTLFPAFFSR